MPASRGRATRVTVDRAPRSRASAPRRPSPSTTRRSSPRCAAWRSSCGDPAVKKILTEADGIGTPATRAAIIETLFERGYVERVGRAIVSTETGRALIRSLPEVATTPDMTAAWEAALRAIADGQADARRVPRARRRAARAARRRGTRPRPHRGPARRAGHAAGPRPLAPQATRAQTPAPPPPKERRIMNRRISTHPSQRRAARAPHRSARSQPLLVACTHPRRSRVRAALDLGPGETRIYLVRRVRRAALRRGPRRPWQAPRCRRLSAAKHFEDVVLLLHCVRQLALLAQRMPRPERRVPAHSFLRNVCALALGARALAARARRRPAREGPRDDPDAARLTLVPSARSRPMHTEPCT